ncbi:MAG: NAD(P)H-hydrate epimerase [Planctomycetota bacterium]
MTPSQPPQPPPDPPPAITPAQARELDRLAVEELGIPSIVLMENAAINATLAVLDHLADTREREPHDAKLAILCGGGNNGGDGYAIARHLHNWGAHPTLFPLKPLDQITGDAATNAHITQQLGLPTRTLDDPQDLQPFDAVLDAWLGTGVTGPLRPDTANTVRQLNDLHHPALIAIDCPTGLNPITGQPDPTALRAELTITFAAPKLGFNQPSAQRFLGKRVIADIGTPPALLDRVLDDSTSAP